MEFLEVNKSLNEGFINYFSLVDIISKKRSKRKMIKVAQ